MGQTGLDCVLWRHTQAGLCAELCFSRLGHRQRQGQAVTYEMEEKEGREKRNRWLAREGTGGRAAG